MTGEHRSECARYEDRLAELALGILSGRERADVLAHLETCQHCSAEVEQLSLGADALLHLAPEVEPPVGFEVRVFERLGVRHTPRRSVRQRFGARAWVAAAAAVVVLGVGVAIGTMASSNPPSPSKLAGPHLSANQHSKMAELVADGERRGTAVISPGKPRWLFMMVTDAKLTGHVTCEVTEADGTTIKIGTFRLAKGYGSWGAALPTRASDVTGASIVSANGTVLASATFRS